MHYGFKSTPTWTLRGRPQSIYPITQHLSLKIQGLPTMLYESLCIIQAMFLQSPNQETYINNLILTQDQEHIILKLSQPMGRKDQ